MSKNILWIMLLVLFTTSAYAINYENQSITGWADASQLQGVNETDVYIYQPDGSLFVLIDAVQVNNATYQYNFTPNSSGNWIATESFYNSSGLIISNNQEYTIQSLEENTMVALSGLSLILAITAVSIIMLIISFNLDKEHMLLKILSIFCVVIFFIIMAKAALDGSNQSADIFFRVIMGYFVIFTSYMFFYYAYKVFQYMSGSAKN